nr:universal stress protein [uncultured Mucilaginibacter sp.]
MEKILVTTDLSVNSKPGIRFAMQLAEQRDAELIVLHVFYVLKATSWSAETYNHYVKKTKENLEEELAAFLRSIQRATNVPKIKCQVALKHNTNVVTEVMAFAKENDCAYICISTRGAGIIKKIFGTHTSDLITHSPIPVISVPNKWRLKPINKVSYATDLMDYDAELKKVVAFAQPVKAKVDMLYLTRLNEILPDKELIEKSLKKETGYRVNVSCKRINIENTVLEEIDDVLELNKTSVLVLFTHQHRKFLDRVVFPGNAEQYCFYGKVPLLTFNKEK